MDSKQIGSEDLASPGIQGFKDWASNPAKDTAAGRQERQLHEDCVMAAKLSEGETVITIGTCPEMGPSMMAKTVGTTGQVIGIIPKKAITEAAQALMQCRIPNVHCMESSMTTMEARDNSADVVMCSMLSNHVPPREMQSVFDEMLRVLKPGGRICMIDIMVRKELSESVRSVLPTACNMLRNGIMTGIYESYLKTAGFENISMKDTRKDVNTGVMEQQGGRSTQQHEPSSTYDSQQTSRKEDDKNGSYRRKVGKFTRQLVAGHEEKEEDVDWNEYAGVFQIMARKPQ